MLRRFPRFACLALPLLAAHAAGAAEPPPSAGPGSPDDSKPYSWGLGIGGVAKQQAYAGIDRDYLPIPVIYFENDWVQLMGPTLEFKLPGIEWRTDQAVSFGIRAEFDGSGYKASDAPILSGMAKRKSGILAGAGAKWSNPVVDVVAEWMIDASGASKGQRMTFGLERQFPLGNHFMLTPSASATLLNRKYADYYYGVRSTEARAGRAAYTAGSTVNTEIGLRTDYMIDQKQALFLALEYTALGSEIKDSPLTDRSGESMVFLGYLYRF